MAWVAAGVQGCILGPLGCCSQKMVVDRAFASGTTVAGRKCPPLKGSMLRATGAMASTTHSWETCAF